MNNNFLKILIVGCFISVPILSSLISTVHLVDMYFLGNPTWVSIGIAITVEIGAIASFLTLSILSKLNKTIVWSMFILLFLIQVIGNVYFSYDWVTSKLKENPNWLSSFKEMIEFFSYEITLKNTKMILAMFIGIPIPLISVFLLKSLADYVVNDEKSEVVKDDITREIKEDKVKPEPIKEEPNEKPKIRWNDLKEDKSIENKSLNISEELKLQKNVEKTIKPHINEDLKLEEKIEKQVVAPQINENLELKEKQEKLVAPRITENIELKEKQVVPPIIENKEKVEQDLESTTQAEDAVSPNNDLSETYFRELREKKKLNDEK